MSSNMYDACANLELRPSPKLRDELQELLDASCRQGSRAAFADYMRVSTEDGALYVPYCTKTEGLCVILGKGTVFFPPDPEGHLPLGVIARNMQGISGCHNREIPQRTVPDGKALLEVVVLYALPLRPGANPQSSPGIEDSNL